MTDIVPLCEITEQVEGKVSGKLVYKGTRLPVYVILHFIFDGASDKDIRAEYPSLTPLWLRSTRKAFGR